MALITIQSWLVALPLDIPTGLVVGSFRELLEVSPITNSALASELDVAHSTVGRWAAAKTVPSLEEMSAAAEVIEARLAEIQERAGRARRILDAAQAAVAAREEGAGSKEKVKRLEAAQRRLVEVIQQEYPEGYAREVELYHEGVESYQMKEAERSARFHASPEIESTSTVTKKKKHSEKER